MDKEVSVKMSSENCKKLMKMIEDREQVTGRRWSIDDLLDSILWGMY